MVALAACGAEHKPAQHPVARPRESVQVAEAQRLRQTMSEEVVGTVRARQVAAISPSVMGTIRALKVKLGSEVRAGDVLAQLAVGEIDAKAAQAQAAFAQAEIELKRGELLKTSGSIPAAQYDSLKAHYKVAEAALAEAEAMRAYTVIRAPFAGVVTEKACNVGDLAVPGKPLLSLETPGALRLEAFVPEGLASTLRQGDALEARFDNIAQPVPVSVSELSPSADAESRSVLVKVNLPTLPGLRSGMFGRLRVGMGERPVVVVPSEAVLRRGQIEAVFVVERDEALLRLVRTARRDAEQSEVVAGLEGGEHVVLKPSARLSDQQPVAVRP